MKPKMLLIGGWGWSATSPLVYTLQRNVKYAHFGYTKVFRYLGNVKFKLARLYKKVSNNTDHINDITFIFIVTIRSTSIC